MRPFWSFMQLATANMQPDFHKCGFMQHTPPEGELAYANRPVVTPPYSPGPKKPVMFRPGSSRLQAAAVPRRFAPWRTAPDLNVVVEPHDAVWLQRKHHANRSAGSDRIGVGGAAQIGTIRCFSVRTTKKWLNLGVFYRPITKLHICM